MLDASQSVDLLMPLDSIQSLKRMPSIDEADNALGLSKLSGTWQVWETDRKFQFRNFLSPSHLYLHI
jgi:hypothetical protein